MYDSEFVSKVTDKILNENETIESAFSMKVDSAWDKILPEFRSEHEGWTKAGEFACTKCGTQIGKNLKGQQPFASAAEHVKAHSLPPRKETATPSRPYERGESVYEYPSEYGHSFSSLKNRTEY